MSLRSLFADTAPLKSAPFRRLWSANIVTVIGSQITVVVVPAQIYSITESSTDVGLTGLFGLVPLVVFGLWGGALADRFDRRKMMLTTTWGLIATSVLFFLLAFAEVNNVWALLIVFGVQQAFFAANQPTRNALLPKIVPNEHLAAATTLNMTVMTFGAIAGPLIGGALLPVLGYSWLYLIDACSMLFTLYAVFRLPPLPVENPSGSIGLRAVIDGFKYLAWHKVLLVSFAADLIAMGFGQPRALYPEVAHVDFGGPATGGFEFGLLSAAMAVGAVLGGVFSGWVPKVRRQGRAVILAVSIWGLAVVGMGVAVWFAELSPLVMLLLASFMLALGGAADMASSAFRNVILLDAADDQVRGRLQGAFSVVVMGGPRIADVVHGYLGDVIGAAQTILIGGVLVVICIWALAALVPKFYAYIPSYKRL
ncbi:MAG: MFS transporter [Propionibacteriaceae bacterium]|jgi:MFS family permease|nr:MFS transporter [Propionibacteriaceae bacterium]